VTDPGFFDVERTSRERQPPADPDSRVSKGSFHRRESIEAAEDSYSARSIQRTPRRRHATLCSMARCSRHRWTHSR